jgi:hypothetical protein
VLFPASDSCENARIAGHMPLRNGDVFSAVCFFLFNAEACSVIASFSEQVDDAFPGAFSYPSG